MKKQITSQDVFKAIDKAPYLAGSDDKRFLFEGWLVTVKREAENCVYVSIDDVDRIETVVKRYVDNMQEACDFIAEFVNLPYYAEYSVTFQDGDDKMNISMFGSIDYVYKILEKSFFEVQHIVKIERVLGSLFFI